MKRLVFAFALGVGLALTIGIGAQPPGQVSPPATTIAPASAVNGAGQAVNLTLSSWLFLASVTQGALGSPTNGAIIYCSDCTVANPCASGGTGALAKRVAGAWVCN